MSLVSRKKFRNNSESPVLNFHFVLRMNVDRAASVACAGAIATGVFALCIYVNLLGIPLAKILLTAAVAAAAEAAAAAAKGRNKK